MILSEIPTEKAYASAHIENIKEALEDKWPSIQNASYETGLLGLSLFYAYYAVYTSDKKYLGKAEEFFRKGVDAMSLSGFKRIYTTDSLDSHLANIGRFVEFCNGTGLLELDADDYLLDIDDVLSGLMKSKIAMGNFDLNCGALAAGYYYLSRSERLPSIEGHLSTLVSGIESMSCKDPEGDYFWEVPVFSQRVYLGISHGSALIISFLTNVYEKGVERKSCRRILYKAINFLLKQQCVYEKGLFPNFIGDPETDRKQFSLCYGDLGIGYALYRAATVLEDTALLISATAILEDCLTRKKEDNLTLDASITYGAAGLAAVFEKMYRISDEGRYLDAADYWYGQIPSYAIHANDFAGYKSRLANTDTLWNISFGWGIIGIGISLMRYVKRDLPPIDRLLSVA